MKAAELLLNLGYAAAAGGTNALILNWDKTEFEGDFNFYSSIMLENIF